MIEAIVPASSLKISELSDNPSLKITASGLSSNNQLYIGLSDGRLLLYQLPTKPEIAHERSHEYDSSLVSSGADGSQLRNSAEQNEQDTPPQRRYIFEPSKIEEEEATLINSFQLQSPATQIQFLEYINYVILLTNKSVEVYTLTTQHDLRLVDEFDEFKFNLIRTWTDTNPGFESSSPFTDGPDVRERVREEDSEYDNQDDDSISLATVKFQNRPATGTDKKFAEERSNCSFLCIASKKYLVILRWRLRAFETKSEFKLQERVTFLEFLNSETLIVAFEGGEFAKMNTYTGQQTPIQFQFLSGISPQSQLSRSSFFFGSSTGYLSEAFKTTNDKQLVILKDNNLIKLNNNMEPITFVRSRHSIDFKNPLAVSQFSSSNLGSSSQKKLKALKYWFPYLVIVYGNCIELRSLENFGLIQQLDVPDPKQLGNVIDVQLNWRNLLLVTNSGVYKFLKSDYNYQLKQFEDDKDYNNAINLLEKLNPIILEEGEEDNTIQTVEHSHSARQLKFMKLRKLQLLKALTLMTAEKFEQAVKLFIEFMASPSFVLGHLPERAKVLLSEDPIKSSSQSPKEGSPEPKEAAKAIISSINAAELATSKKRSSPSRIKRKEERMINEIITYLTDTRRKLTRLLDPDQPKFQWHGYTISLALYEELQTEPDFSAVDNLKLIDNNLFKCYLLTNLRMIGPFLRIPNYCDFELVEKKCLRLKMHSELIDFYYIRGAHEKALELLEKLCFDSDGRDNMDDRNSSLSMLFNVEYMVRYLQKLGNEHLALILKYSRKLIELDAGYFKMIFMNNSNESEGLDRTEVLAYTIEHDWIPIETAYLNYVIFELDDTGELFVNSLLWLYLEGDLTESYSKIIDLYGLGNYDFRKTLKKLDTLKGEENGDEARKDMILKLKIDPLRRLKRHHDAIRIFLEELKDNRGAIGYCLEVKKDSPDEGIDLIYYLLQTHLSQGNMQLMMQMLSDPRLTFLDPVAVAERLPDAIPLKILTPFLEMNLRNVNSAVKSSTLESELLKVRLIDARYDKLQLEKQHYRITADSRCPVCGESFGATSILSLLPDGTVVHYRCSRNIE
ncbi:DEKNAAC105612 [Brettanomyces naardenensis]|uniref:DEKNAAC105612 n=1 Tax=Brettanomyces naardenensis TaxID=13370 RepID=A0A448YU12_BRENA|nr:DEKNAAC105612 [Brettanomyces naardenensis]